MPSETHVLTKRSRQRLLRVARAIKNHEIDGLGFNLEKWVSVGFSKDNSDNPHFCGTTACIAGYAAALSVPDKASKQKIMGLVSMDMGHWVDMSHWGNGVQVTARNWLGVSVKDADNLFTGNGRDTARFIYLRDVTASQAIATLIKFAKTGVVDWQALPSAWNNPEKHLAALSAKPEPTP